MPAPRHRSDPSPARRAAVRRAAPAAALTALVAASLAGAVGHRSSVDATAGASLVGRAGAFGSSQADLDNGLDAAALRPVKKVLSGSDVASPYVAQRLERFSRSAQRITLVDKPDVTGHPFRTEPLNLWPTPQEKGSPLAVLPRGGRVSVTGVHRNGFAQILYAGQLRWVNATYLAAQMPQPDPTPLGADGGVVPSGSAPSSSGASAPSGGGVTLAPCPDGSATESGLTSSAVRLFRSVCNAFPALTTYGGYDAHGEHASGRAIDFMLSDPALGQAVADWIRAHAAQLDLYDVIWQQHIWTPQRASEGWRLMPDRGSATANHFDHVHASVN